MGITRNTTTPTILSLADLHVHLHIDGETEDAALDAIQRAAIDYIERTTGSQIGTGTFTLTLDHFPCGRILKLPKPPLASVQAVQYIGPAGTPQTLAADTYTVRTDEKPGRIVLKAGQSWPATADEAGAVTITYTAGHVAGSEPDTFKHLVRLIVGAWFEMREGATDRRFDELPVPFAVTALLQLHTFTEQI